MMQQVFAALASVPRRKILVYLAEADLTAGEIAAGFAMSKPSISKHLAILENAGLIRGDKRGHFIHYRLTPDSLVNTLHGFVREVCPVSRPLKCESRSLRSAKP